MRNSIIVFFIIIFSIGSLSSCKSTKNVVTGNKTDLKKDFILKSFVDNSLLPAGFTSPIDFTFTDKGKTISLSGNIRFVKDSAIWISLSPGFGLEVARIFITNDSVFILERLKSKCYYGRMEEMSQALKFDFDFNGIQCILTGSFSPNQRSFFKARTFKSAELSFTDNLIGFAGLESGIDNLDISNLYLFDNNFKVNRLDLLFKQTSNLKIEYSNFTVLDRYLLPDGINIQLSMQDRDTRVEVAYKKIEISENISLSFKIPSKYEQVSILNLTVKH